MVMYVRDNGFDVLSIEYGVVKRVFLSVSCFPIRLVLLFLW